MVAEHSIRRRLSMNTQRFLKTTSLLAMTLLIALGGVWGPAAAKSGTFPIHENETIALGNHGIHATNIPVGVSSVYLDMVGKKLPARFSQKVDLNYRRPAMEVRFLNEKGGQVDRISAQVYVFFSISRGERARWLKGGMEEIAIWYVNESIGSWELCPTFFVNESAEGGNADRLACLAPVSGYYALGHSDLGYPFEKSAGAGVISANKLPQVPQ
jgi:hypothetical protein